MQSTTARLTVFGIIILAALGAVFFWSGADREGGRSSTDARPTVAATIFPLADIVRNIAGDEIRVQQLLPTGANPHAFEPTPSLLRGLADTEVIYAIGHGLDDWALTLRAEARAGYVVVDKGIALRATGSEHADDILEGHTDADHHDDDDHDDADHHDEDEVIEDDHSDDDHHDDADRHDDDGDHDDADHHLDHVHGPVDPHYWLDVRNAIRIATTVRDDLASRFPEHTAALHENHARYVAELEALHEEVQVTLAARSWQHPIVTLHDAWQYFAAAYGLEVVGSLEPSPGREPTPGYLAALTEAVRMAGTPVIFSEPGVGSGSIEAFANDNDLTIRMLDPEGGNVPGRMSYVELMRYNARTIVGW